MEKLEENWHQIQTSSQSARFICGYCNSDIGSDKTYYTIRPNYNTHVPRIFICHVCNRPTFIEDGKTYPAAPLGHSIKKLPHDINAIYEEIRAATSVNAYTAAVLTARKLLMHVAVEKGAKENNNFLAYVNYLDENHYTPPGSKGWVDKIRKLGNDANHEIVIMNKEQAILILGFIEMILKFSYEFPDPPDDEPVVLT